MSIYFRIAIENWRATRAEYELFVEASYARAEEMTNGVLLNARGKEAGIDPYTLFSGAGVRAAAYASEELLEHWQCFPRMSYSAFEAQRVEQPA